MLSCYSFNIFFFRKFFGPFWARMGPKPQDHHSTAVQKNTTRARLGSEDALDSKKFILSIVPADYGRPFLNKNAIHFLLMFFFTTKLRHIITCGRNSSTSQAYKKTFNTVGTSQKFSHFCPIRYS